MSSARISATVPDGTVLTMYVEVTLEDGYNVSRDFDLIARQIETAAYWQIRDLKARYPSIDVIVQVVAPGAGTDRDLQLLFNAATKGLRQMPHRSVVWLSRR